MCVYDKPFVTITFDKKTGIIIQTWKGYCFAEDFIEAIDFSIDFLEKNNIYKVLSDIRDQRSISPNEQKYVTSKIEKFLEKHGKFKMAFILPKSILAGMGVKYFAEKTKTRLKKELTRFFENTESAIEWLDTG